MVTDDGYITPVEAKKKALRNCVKPETGKYIFDNIVKQEAEA